jgi:ABC-type glycerol-3-phosphate transport system substrate-binding protein
MTERIATDGSVSRRRFLRAAGAGGVASGLAGCSDITSGGSPGSTPGGTVTVFSAMGYEKNEETLRTALHEAGLPDSITVELNPGPQTTIPRERQVEKRLEGDSTDPDLVLTGSSWTIPFVVDDLLANLGEQLPEEFVSTIRDEGVESVVKAGTHPDTGDLYSVPIFSDVPTIQYRKDLLEQAGYGESDFSSWRSNPPTWSTFTSLVQEVQDAAGTQYGHVWQGENYVGLACCTFNEFLASMGGAYFGDQENSLGPVGDRPVTLDTEKAVDGIELGRDLIHGGGESPLNVAGVSPTEVTQWTERDTETTFENQQALTQRNWTYAIDGVTEAFEGTDAELGVMPLPKGPNGAWHALGGWLLSMNPHSDNTAAARAVVEAWWQDSFLETQLDVLDSLPPKPGLFESAVSDHPTYGPHADALGYAVRNSIPRPASRVWPTQRNVVAEHVHAALAEETSPREAAEAMQSKVAEIEAES